MSALFLAQGCGSARVTPIREQTAYRGLIEMHAQELARSEKFQRLGRLTPGQVHAIAADLHQLGRKHQLDETIELILARADAIDLTLADESRRA